MCVLVGEWVGVFAIDFAPVLAWCVFSPKLLRLCSFAFSFSHTHTHTHTQVSRASLKEAAPNCADEFDTSSTSATEEGICSSAAFTRTGLFRELQAAVASLKEEQIYETAIILQRFVLSHTLSCLFTRNLSQLHLYTHTHTHTTHSHNTPAAYSHAHIYPLSLICAHTHTHSLSLSYLWCSIGSLIHKKKREYSELVNVYSDLAGLCHNIVQSDELQGRLFANYYRVAFYGDDFGRVNGHEFIYKEHGFVRLSDISSRLRERVRVCLGLLVFGGVLCGFQWISCFRLCSLVWLLLCELTRRHRCYSLLVAVLIFCFCFCFFCPTPTPLNVQTHVHTHKSTYTHIVLCQVWC
jgi:hypothetical protein